MKKPAFFNKRSVELWDSDHFSISDVSISLTGKSVTTL